MWIENNIFKEDLDYIMGVNFVDWEKLNNKIVFVTGTTGLIGYYLVSALIYRNTICSSNIQVIALVRNTDKAKDMFSAQLKVEKNFKLVEGDLENIPDIEESIDYIIHGASVTCNKYFIKYPVETIKTSVIGTMNILELAKRNNIHGMVYLSSIEIYGVNKKDEKMDELYECNIDTMEPRSCYSESKRMCENLCSSFYSEYDIPVNVLRLTQTLGPGVKEDDNRVFAQFLKSYFHHKDIILYTPGKSCRSCLYIADAVTAILTVMLCGKYNQAYNCANESTYGSIANMADLVANNIGDGRIKVLFKLKKSNELKEYISENYINLDTGKIRALGWRSTVNLENIFRRTIKSNYKHN